MGRSRSLVRLAAAALAVLGVTGCQAETLLALDVRTDLTPGVEMSRVRLTLEPPEGEPQTVEVPIDPEADYLAGVRVAEWSGIPPGVHTVEVELLDDADEVVLSRPLRVTLSDRLVTTVILTRDCRDVVCPAADGDANATACLGGTCVDPECSAENLDVCGEPDCADDGECGGGPACGVGRCVAGTCLLRLDDGLCGAEERCGVTGCVPTTPPAPVDRAQLEAQPERALADGNDAVTLTVELFDAMDAPVAGVTVAPEISGAATFELTPLTAATDASGKATFTLRSTEAGARTVSIRLGAAGGTLAQLEVSFEQVLIRADADDGVDGTMALRCETAPPAGVRTRVRWFRDGAPFALLRLPMEGPSPARDWSGYDRLVTPGMTVSWVEDAGRDGSGAYRFAGGYLELGDVVPRTKYTKIAWVRRTGADDFNNIFSGSLSAGGLQTHALFCRTMSALPGGPDFELAAGHAPTTMPSEWYQAHSCPDPAMPASCQAILADTPTVVAASYEATNTRIRMFIDGAMVDEDLAARAIPDIGAEANDYLGAYDASFFFNGEIDEVHLYGEELPPAQIEAIQREGDAVIVPDMTAVGQTWRCEALFFDGATDPTPVPSNEVTIR